MINLQKNKTSANKCTNKLSQAVDQKPKQGHFANEKGCERNSRIQMTAYNYFSHCKFCSVEMLKYTLKENFFII